MLATLNVLFMGLVLGGLPAWVTWGWVTWVRNHAKPLRTAAVLSLLGLAFASASALLEMGSVLYLQLSRGPSLEPAALPELHAVGLVFAGLGLVSLLGGMPRTPAERTTPALSLAMLAIWALHVCSQDL